MPSLVLRKGQRFEVLGYGSALRLPSVLALIWGKRGTGSFVWRLSKERKECLWSSMRPLWCFRKELQRFEHLLFFTHGLLPREPESDLPLFLQGPSRSIMSEPSLLLQRREIKSPENAARKLDLLQGNDAFGLRIRAKAIWLAACETGRGTDVPGEGALSLARKFLLAGTEGVQMTLWKVAKQETGWAMADVGRMLWRGKKADEALQEAQERLRTKRGRPHPFYWAGYVLLVR